MPSRATQSPTAVTTGRLGRELGGKPAGGAGPKPTRPPAACQTAAAGPKYGGRRRAASRQEAALARG
eukprot:2490941-Lingulodinium_polyedra.AAC.1